MTLAEGRRVFRDALLVKRPESKWPKARIYHVKFYSEKFRFEGKELIGKELVNEYARRFPDDNTHSLRAELNRMLSECGIQQFSFLSSSILRKLLLSSMSKKEWKEYVPRVNDFRSREFCWDSIRIRGQMLLKNVRLELLNQMNGTYYAYIDYLAGPKPRLPLVPLGDPRLSDYALVKHILSRAKVEVYSPLRINDADLSHGVLMNILLSLKSEGDWKLWAGTTGDFCKMRFEPAGYAAFSGALLLERYRSTNGASLEAMFAEAGLEAGTDPSLKIGRIKAQYEKTYPYDLLDPVQMRELLLQVCSEKEWKKPQVFANLRKKRVNIEDKEKRGPALSLHTLMQIYCVQKYNHEQTLRTGEPSYLTLNDFQHTPDLVKFLRSNVETLKEMLDLAGIYYGKAFIPSITGLDLKDPSVLRRLLLNGSLGGLPFDVNKARKSGKIMEFRKAEFTDPKTGLEVRGHGLMLYFSVQDYLSKHPGVIPSTAVFELKLGRSSLKVMREILQLAGIGKDK